MLDTIRRAQPAIIKTVLGAVVIAFIGTIFLEWGWQRPGRLDSHLAKVVRIDPDGEQSAGIAGQQVDAEHHRRVRRIGGVDPVS
jgi:hypothetical protein